jgi:hypothetical protein
VGATDSSNAYFASVSSSGFGSWTSTTPEPTANAASEGVACAITSGYIYCVGGSPQGSGTNAVNSTYYAQVSSSGIGPWTATTQYPLGVTDASCAISGDYIYCVGGSTNANPSGNNEAVYYAPVSESGVGSWTSTTSYPINVWSESCNAFGGYIYCVNGGGNSLVYYASLSSTGVGTWTSTTGYPSNAQMLGCAISGSNSYIYCVGGVTLPYGQSVNSVYYASVSSSGVGSWSSGANYPADTGSPDCATSGGYLYCAYYPTSAYSAISSSASSSLTVESQNTSGTTISGYYTILYQGGNVVATSFTPATFALNDGQSYVVQVGNYSNCQFNHWADTGSTSSSRTISISADTQITAVYSCGTTTTSSVTISSVDQNGNAIDGYYVALLQGGNVLASGYTTMTFSVTSGQTYDVQADSYGSCLFSHWSDGVVNDPRSFTATSASASFTAVYSCGTSGGISTINVSTVNSAGAPISGYYITLWQNGVQQQSCFSTCAFAVGNGTYQVLAESYGSETFSHWQNDGSTGYETITVPINGTTFDLTAVYSP